MLNTDRGFTINVLDLSISFNGQMVFIHQKWITARSNFEVMCMVDEWLHKRYSTTTEAIFMKLGEVKLDKQCYILPQKSFPEYISFSLYVA